MPKYVSEPIPLPPQSALGESSSWIITVKGVNLAGPSYKARVFLNNEDANEDTPTTPESGYAGSFDLYGYGLNPSEAHPRVPIERSVDGTDAIRKVVYEGQKAAKVTVVPIPAQTLPGQSATLEENLGIQGAEITPK